MDESIQTVLHLKYGIARSDMWAERRGEGIGLIDTIHIKNAHGIDRADLEGYLPTAIKTVIWEDDNV